MAMNLPMTRDSDVKITSVCDPAHKVTLLDIGRELDERECALVTEAVTLVSNVNAVWVMVWPSSVALSI
jgi:hypothetical protein